MHGHGVLRRLGSAALLAGALVALAIGGCDAEISGGGSPHVG
jgi:hypothetical protein